MAENNDKGKEGLNEEKKDIFKTWADSYTNVSKMWMDSYSTLYKPLLESTGEEFEKAAELLKGATPQKYKEFYEEWTKKYQNTFGKFYPIQQITPNKEVLEKFISSAEESNKVYMSWIAELEENSRKTKEILQGTPDPAKFKEISDTWAKSYEKILDAILTTPLMESTKEVLEKYTGIPDIYLGSFAQVTKLWKNTYSKLYRPWIESMQKLSAKMMEISRGEASPEVYKEFFDTWLATYRVTYGKYAHSARPSKDVFESFVESTNIYLNMYKSWLAALEKMVEKTKELSEQATDPEAYGEFYNLWVQMYEKAFLNFFEDMPVVGPVKEMMEPVKNMAKIYADTFNKIYNMWLTSDIGHTKKS